ncbi:FtsK/SpoIIIE domain-containing protein [Streptomyces sp. NPDC088732]|uniref:FtsK/SpoIIIE domain-containing protein n=1 Tax=Streptomyces sp. NPDC088732 TaxID=3365879 RepID=UPI00380FDF87
MQIRLTVLGPRGGRGARSSDVLVTAPAGTLLGAVAGALTSGTGSSGQPARSTASLGSLGSLRSLPPLYAGAERLDPATAVLGVPPLLDGAVLSLHAPADGHHEERPSAAARLHVIGGPDAGGVHLLQGGRIRVGRSADADVPLDDPDVSRLHCAITVDAAGRVTVHDLGSTNGTTLDGRPVGPRGVPFDPGALLRIGESLLQLEPTPPGSTVPPPPASIPAVPDAEGHLHVTLPPASWPDGDAVATWRPARPAGPADHSDGPGATAGEAPADTGPAEAPGAPGTAAPEAPPAPAGGAGGRRDTPQRGLSEQARAVVPAQGRRSAGRAAEAGSRMAGAIGSWARRLATGRDLPDGTGPDGSAGPGHAVTDAAGLRERWPDPAAVLLTALGPGPRLWERAPGHPDTLTVRLGTADLPAEDGYRTLPAVPFTIDLRDPHTQVLGLAGPRPRLTGLARAVIAQLCALHPPGALEVALLAADRSRPAEQRAEEWAWLHWLPHLRPARGQDCRLLTATDREQAEARVAELVRRIEEGPLGTGWATATPEAVAEAAADREGPHTLLVVDGDPGSAYLGEAVDRIAATGPSVGVHVLCLAENQERLAAQCGAVAVLEGDVATTLRIEPHGPERMTVEAVSTAWAERFARALAPLREGDAAAPRVTRSALPRTARLLDELDLALATPAKIAARWAAPAPSGGAAAAVLGAGPGGRVLVDLVAEGPHLLVGGAPGSGKTELLRSVAAALAAAERPDRLALVLVDGAGTERGEGLRVCTDLPHVSTYLCASDPVRMREFAQALAAELKRREELLDGLDFRQWHDRHRVPVVPRQAEPGRTPGAAGETQPQGAVRVQTRTAEPLPRLVVVVDDFDALVAPALGSPGRPAAGSVVRALESVARDGERLGVHLVAATGRPERTAGTEADDAARLRIALRTEEPESAALLVAVEEPAALEDTLPGRGYLRRPDGAVTAFQAGRVSGRIPRTATLRPTVVPLEWDRMGDPPTRRPVRELGNGPTDLALLASALQRAAESAAADPAPPLL